MAMTRIGLGLATGLLLGAVSGFAAQDKADKTDKGDTKDKKTEVVVSGTPAAVPDASGASAAPADSATEGTVTVGGQAIAYKAVAGTITVAGTDAEDAMLGLDGRWLADTGEKIPDKEKPDEAPATARMFYTAYFKQDAKGGKGPGLVNQRPITFIYNGGPGSATMWLHMGSFGPKRVVTPDAEHEEGAPYRIVDNAYSLLDVSDVVFIDAPGTGFSRIMGKDKETSFWGTDEDAHAFDRFIRRFLTKYDRWNSPKYLFGESYGTPRTAVLSAVLENVDLNGIILLSQILSFDNSADGPKWNPGVDQAYALALPTYAASAFYHKKLPVQPPALGPFLAEVEQYAVGGYMAALLQGSDLPEAQRQAVAEKLHGYTGLPVAFLLRSNLRVSGGAFSKNLELDAETTTGRLDTRYKGPDLNPTSEEAEYDPQSSAISSAYTAAINQYLRVTLKYGRDLTYKPTASSDEGFSWDLRHQAPGGAPVGQEATGTNVMPDLAYTMKENPKMKVMLAGGYYDLATPYFEGKFEMKHLQIPQKLQGNISYHYYESGHMVYVNEGVLKQFHDDVAAFIRGSQDGK